MKISVIMFIFTISLASAYDANGQNALISLSVKNRPVSEVLDHIEKQSNYFFFYNNKEVDVNRSISMDVENKQLRDVLNIMFNDSKIRYSVLDNSIILTNREVVTQAAEKSQSITVSGVVVDASGETMPGVNIFVKGTTTGVVTDFNGKYSINVPDRDAVLVFSFVGYATQEIAVGNRTFVDVVLEEDARQIEEVVVTALGIRRAQKALSYNVQEVKGEELTMVKNASFINSLSGKVAGVQINSSAAGPGGAVKVIMRGAKSLTKNNNALYVIDGVPMYNSNRGNDVSGYYASQPASEGAADINPDDIESISMLTGPSAAALYGYEGANGVVLITTKKGRAGRTSVTVSNSTTFSNPLMLPKFQNKYGNALGEMTSWGNETPYRHDPAKFFRTGSNIANSVSVEIGNDKNQTYLSMGSNNASGILPNNGYNRYNFTFRNTTSFLKDKLVLDASANYIIQNDLNMVSQGQYFNPLPAVYLFPRGEDFDEVLLFERYDEAKDIQAQFWTYGDQGLSLQNPYWIMKRMNKEHHKNRYIFTASLKYNITDWFNVIGRMNVDNSVFEGTEKRYASTLTVFAGPKGYYRLDNRSERQAYGDVIANINKYIGDVSVHVNLGASFKHFKMNGLGIMGNFNNGNLTNVFTIENLNRGGGYKTIDLGFQNYVQQSVFGSAEIGYKSMVYLTLTGRNDWDTALAFNKNKSFFYPSVGLSGIVSEMVALPEWFSYLKARLSYTGVATAFDRYIHEYYAYDEQMGSYNANQMYPNYNLKPESTNSLEAGLNMRFFKGSLRFDATYYKSNTLNQTFRVTLPSASGYSFVLVQAGDVENSGVELSLGYDRKFGDVNWSSNLVYSFNKNTIKKLANGLENPATGEPIEMPYLDVATLGSVGSPIVRLVDGGTMGDIWVNREWKRDGNGYIYLDSKTGLPSLIQGEYQKVGTTMPKGHAGWRNSISYKGITLNALVSARFGGLVVSNTQAILDRYGVSEYSANLRETEILINNEKIPVREYLEIVAAGTGQGARYVYDATNIRLGEVSIHYTIPKKWTGNVADITVGLTGSNLAMIYCKAPFDPESVASATHTFYTGVDYFMQPSLRHFGFNVKLQF